MLVSWNVRDRFRVWSKAMNTRRGRSRKHAVTLIEAVLFVSIALGLIVGGLVFYGQASLAHKVTAQMRVASAIISEARILVRQKLPFNTNLLPILDASGALPASAVLQQVGGSNSSHFISNEWGGKLYLGYDEVYMQATGRSEPAVEFALTDVPEQACVRLVTLDASGNNGYLHDVLAVRFASNYVFPPIFFYRYPPFSPHDAASLCRTISREGVVYGVFFYIKP